MAAIELPRWGTDQTNENEPLEALKDSGWTNGDKPPASVVNWNDRLTYENLLQVKQRQGALVLESLTARSAAASFAGSFFDVIWDSTDELFIAVGASGEIQSSPRGVAWTQVTAVGADNLNSICTGGPLQLCAVGDGGFIRTSTGGGSWTTQTAASAANLTGVAASNSLFVAVSSTGNLDESSDGITWVTVTTAAAAFHAVAYSSLLDTFVAVGASGQIYSLVTPGSGTWTSRTAGSSYSGTFQGVCWSERLGLFIAVGTAGEVQTSPDGTTWTRTRTGSESLTDVVWSDEFRILVAIGTAGQVVFSRDATGWDVKPDSGITTLSGLAESDDLERFVFVGSSGGIETSTLV